MGYACKARTAQVYPQLSNDNKGRTRRSKMYVRVLCEETILITICHTTDPPCICWSIEQYIGGKEGKKNRKAQSDMDDKGAGETGNIACVISRVLGF